MTQAPLPTASPVRPGAPSDLARSRVLLITHGADRTRVPLLLLWWLRWVVAHTDLRFEVLVLGPGPLVPELEALATTHVVDVTTEPTGADVEVARAIDRLDAVHRRQARAGGRAAAELGDYDVAILTSGLAGDGLGLLAERPPVVISWVHLMGTSLEHQVRPTARAAMLTSDWFVSSCDAVATTLVGRYGVPRSRILTHHGFIEPFEADPPGAAALRDSLGIPADALVIGSVGVQQWRKGPDLFVQVLAQVRRNRPDMEVHGIWAGASATEEVGTAMSTDIARLDLADRLHVLPGYDDPAAVMGAFDVFCMTSREDPFPLVLLEAAWLGLPVVSFATSGLRELEVGAGPDRLVNVVDYLAVESFVAEVVALLNDPGRRRQEGERLHSWVERHHLTSLTAPRLLTDLETMVRTSLSGASRPDRAWQGSTL